MNEDHNIRMDESTSSECPHCGLPENRSELLSLATPKVKHPGNSFQPMEELGLVRVAEAEGRAKIKVIQDAIDRLKADQATLETAIQERLSFFSPINRVPNDILIQIFVWLDVTHSPWTVSQVCRRWRELSTSCSYLWTDLDYRNLDRMCSSAASLRRLELQIARSKERPLYLAWTAYQAWDDGKDYPEDQDEDDDNAMTIILDNAHRFVSMVITDELSDPEKLPKEPPNFANLQYLSLSDAGHGEAGGAFWAVKRLFDRTPLLHSLCLNDVPASETFNTFSWSNITCLKMHRLRGGSADYLTIFQSAANLVHLKVCEPLGYDEPSNVEHEIVTLPRLKVADFGFEVDPLDEEVDEHMAHLHQALHHLRAPQLETLTIRWAGYASSQLEVGPQDLDISTIVAFVQNSKATVKKLAIEGRREGDANYRRVLKSMPSLEEVRLTGDSEFQLRSVLSSLRYMDEDHLYADFTHPDHLYICPTLRHLIIDGGFFELEDVRKLVGSRCFYAPRQLERVTFITPRVRYRRWGKWDNGYGLDWLENWIEDKTTSFSPKYELRLQEDSQGGYKSPFHHLNKIETSPFDFGKDVYSPVRDLAWP